MLYMENTEQRGTGIENGSEWPDRTVHSDRTAPSEKGGPPCAVADYGHDVPSTPDGMYTVLAVDKQIEFGWKY